MEDPLAVEDANQTSILSQERREWSKLISVICYLSLVSSVLAVVLLFVLLFLPGVLGFSHKDYVIGVVSLFFACILFLLYKARDDSHSLIKISISAVALSWLVIGFSSGQLYHHRLA